ncbi:MAG: GAF domain-containing sensor histidine kinase [Symploca sp. SIO2B6]|nr:GAF domain-containing sensor histidine kinase [Symploca sp. SIO2B6]
MSIPQRAEPLSTSNILASVTHVANMICAEQSLDQVCDTVLDEIQNLLGSDRSLLGQWISSTNQKSNEPEKLSDAIEQGGNGRWVDHNSCVWVRYEASETVIPSCLHQTLPVFGEFNFLSFVLNNDGNSPSPVSPDVNANLCLTDQQPKPITLPWYQWPASWAVKTGLVVPIWVKKYIWGVLIVHQCVQNHRWQASEIQLVEQMATQVGIAVQQQHLHHIAQGQVDELNYLNQLKDDFLSTISHELRTPMASIKMASEMLANVLDHITLQSDHRHQVERYVEILQQESDREMNLINNLLALSRLEAKAEPVLLTPLDIGYWLPYLIEVFQAKRHHHQHHITVAIAQDLPILHTDITYVEDIMTELLDNAYKYSPPGATILVKVDTREQNLPQSSEVSQDKVPSYSGDTLAANILGHSAMAQPVIAEHQPLFTFTISNSGIEIPPEEYERAFDKFYRIPNADPWKYSGTGLGLALVKRRVEYLQGHIGVHSHNGWTTFTLTLPSLC